MSLGLQPQKSDIDNLAGSIAADLDRVLSMCQEMNSWLASQPDANLVALGYVQTEVNTLKSAFSDAAVLQTLYVGSVAGTAAKAGAAYDYRTFLKLLSGLRVVR